MYSQNDEEPVIARLLTGVACPHRFLDIGAHDGVTFSNTRRLAEQGWGGTLVEPAPSVFPKLRQNYQGREDVNLVDVAIVPDGAPRQLRFYDSDGDCVSTLDERHRQLWETGGARFRPVTVQAIPFAALVAQYPGPYSVLNLDVEGTNVELFRVIDLAALGVIVACVEYQNGHNEIVQRAARQGYEKVHGNGENIILRRVR